MAFGAVAGISETAEIIGTLRVPLAGIAGGLHRFLGLDADPARKNREIAEFKTGDLPTRCSYS
jgi:hypothetical protein